MVASNVIAKPVRGVGGFYAMALDTFLAMFRPPFAWREFIFQRNCESNDRMFQKVDSDLWHIAQRGDSEIAQHRNGSESGPD